jgi:hypothetical protein
MASEHDTPVRRLLVEPLGLGLVTIDHWSPFHSSINVCISAVVPLTSTSTPPAAKQNDLLTHETLFSEWLGVGLAVIVQFVGSACEGVLQKAAMPRKDPTKAITGTQRAGLIALAIRLDLVVPGTACRISPPRCVYPDFGTVL